VEPFYSSEAMMAVALVTSMASLALQPTRWPIGESALTATAAPSAFSFANTLGDGMVLQAAPKQAMVWGFVGNGSAVTVHFGGEDIKAKIVQNIGYKAWKALLPATAASFDAMTITATSGSSTISIKNVLFGEVWVCSGQSNMEYPIGTPTCWNQSNINCTIKDAQCGYGCCNQSATEIKDMSNYPNMRLLHFPRASSKAPENDMAQQPWQTPEEAGGSFSAACWFFGRDMFSKLKPRRPVGLIEANWGGTPIQHWSLPDAIDACKGPDPWNWPANETDSVLWNGMVVPLLQTTIAGAVW
jgi:sialate O-acetylesterase